MIMKTSPKNSDKERSDVCCFISEYAARLLGCGATCIRIEKNVRRIAASYGFDTNVTVLPSHIIATVSDPRSGEQLSLVRPIAKSGINFAMNTSLSRLSWEIADKKIPLAEARKKFAAILSRKLTSSVEVLVLTSFANASFCRLFGGDIMAMIVVFTVTFIGFRIKQMMLEAHRDVRLTFLVAAFVSASLSAACQLFHIGNTPDIAVGTSILYLIPGVPYINVVSDMLDHHYLCAFSRFIDACILTACLSLGLCFGMLILNIEWF